MRTLPVLIAVSLAACTATAVVPSTTRPPSATALAPLATPPWPAAVTPSTLGGPNCQPPSQVVAISSGGPPPLLGTPTVPDTRAVLALFLRPTVGVEQKMILRMNGEGSLAINARHVDGTNVTAKTDSSHTSSSFDPIFPGTNEWGLFFTFPKDGCWQIHARRDNSGADFYLVVAPA